MSGIPPTANANARRDPATADDTSDFRRIGPEGRHAALVRLLGHGRTASDGQVRQFIHAADALQLSLRWMWGRPAADGSFEAVILIAPQAGRTGMVFLSRPRGLRDVDGHAYLADFACRHTPPGEVVLAQALLELDQELERAALERAAFAYLATLTYMQLHLPRARRRFTADQPPDWPGNVQLLPYRPEHRQLFLDALAASYEQTLDCPGLYGLRDIEDVLRGHMATGRFEPDLWTVLLVDEKPAGVMLLNPVPSAGCVELVYLGLSREQRGKGLARRLLQRAIQLCTQRGESLLTLAVDERNRPARRLYDGFGFRRTTRKVALVRDLR